MPAVCKLQAVETAESPQKLLPGLIVRRQAPTPPPRHPTAPERGRSSQFSPDSRLVRPTVAPLPRFVIRYVLGSRNLSKYVTKSTRSGTLPSYHPDLPLPLQPRRSRGFTLTIRKGPVSWQCHYIAVHRFVICANCSLKTKNELLRFYGAEIQ